MEEIRRIFISIMLILTSILLMLKTNEAYLLKKEIIKRGYAKYDENFNLIWGDNVNTDTPRR